MSWHEPVRFKWPKFHCLHDSRFNTNRDCWILGRGRNRTQAKCMFEEWENSDVSHIEVGQVVTGSVIQPTAFGAFVEIEQGVHGLVLIPEFSWTRKINHGEELLQKGFTRKFQVIAIDYKSRKIALSIKKLIPNPWAQLPHQFPVGTDCMTLVQQIFEWGVLINITGTDFSGMIHVSEFCDEVTLEDVEIGQRIPARIIDLDIEGEQIALKMLPYV